MKIWGVTPDEKLKSVETILTQMEKKKDDFKSPIPIQMPYSISSYVYAPLISGEIILRHMFLSDTSITLGAFIEDIGKNSVSITIDIFSGSKIASSTNPLYKGFNQLDTIELKAMDRLKIGINYESEETKPLGIWVTGDCI